MLDDGGGARGLEWRGGGSNEGRVRELWSRLVDEGMVERGGKGTR